MGIYPSSPMSSASSSSSRNFTIVQRLTRSFVFYYFLHPPPHPPPTPTHCYCPGLLCCHFLPHHRFGSRICSYQWSFLSIHIAFDLRVCCSINGMLTVNFQFQESCIASLLQHHTIPYLSFDVSHCTENPFCGHRVWNESQHMQCQLNKREIRWQELPNEEGITCTVLYSQNQK